eukprot:919337-Rhodomonas_salina.1
MELFSTCSTAQHHYETSNETEANFGNQCCDTVVAADSPGIPDPGRSKEENIQGASSITQSNRIAPEIDPVDVLRGKRLGIDLSRDSNLRRGHVCASGLERWRWPLLPRVGLNTCAPALARSELVLQRTRRHYRFLASVSQSSCLLA